MIGAGRYTKRVTIQYPETTQDAFGQPVVTYRDSYETWASVQALSGREYFASQQIQNKTIKRYVVRYSSVIEPTWRLLDEGVAWNIDNILDSGEVMWTADRGLPPSGVRRELQLLCTRVTT